MRFVILHHHIFKNAGSTLDHALGLYFGEKFIEFHSENLDNGRVFPSELFEFLQENRNIQAVSSHHFVGIDFSAFLSKTERRPFAFLDFALLRHPVSRLVSMYLYYRDIPITTNLIQIAACKLSLSDFIEFLIDSYPNFVINPQVTMFGCEPGGGPPSETNLATALTRLMKMAMVGTVERYDEAVATVSYMLQPLFPKINLLGIKVNVSDSSKIKKYDGSLVSIQQILGKELFDRLCELNDLDIQLWSSVTSESIRRFKYVPKN